MIPAILDTDSDGNGGNNGRISTSTKSLLTSFLNLLQYNKELSRLCDRQKIFFEKYNVIRMSTVNGILSLGNEGCDKIGEHLLTAITAYLNEELQGEFSVI